MAYYKVERCLVDRYLRLDEDIVALALEQHDVVDTSVEERVMRECAGLIAEVAAAKKAKLEEEAAAAAAAAEQAAAVEEAKKVATSAAAAAKASAEAEETATKADAVTATATATATAGEGEATAKESEGNSAVVLAGAAAASNAKKETGTSTGDDTTSEKVPTVAVAEQAIASAAEGAEGQKTEPPPKPAKPVKPTEIMEIAAAVAAKGEATQPMVVTSIPVDAAKAKGSEGSKGTPTIVATLVPPALQRVVSDGEAAAIHAVTAAEQSNKHTALQRLLDNDAMVTAMCERTKCSREDGQFYIESSDHDLDKAIDLYESLLMN